ncbi:uncharacterized protein E2P81_ATG10777 [Venturia nashicola]|uniref:Tat pathway signal sequence n=1 Tax=Venturia nashicola TaxID=86259 RepID=A0A4Z1NWC0_9PEZI|nr:hypothetical protein E6O75_ATG10447 [Venturia nashicola]TLD27489.1 uncharacterized protein E2P81_ATG10777 [Venturia nashicola]
MPFRWAWAARNDIDYVSLPYNDDNAKGRQPQNRKQRRCYYPGLLLGLSALLTTMSLILFFDNNFEIVRKTPSAVQPPYGNPVPPPPLELKKFGPADIFTERANNRSNAAWEALAGPTKSEQGFIYIPNARELNLPPGVYKNGNEMYGISMFHQLHCLGAIRHTLWQLMDGNLDPIEFAAMDGDTTSPQFVPHDHGLWHLKHCFNYVRHALQCYGDTTIEIPTYFDGHKIFLGWNTTHQCRSFEHIWDYTVQHS